MMEIEITPDDVQSMVKDAILKAGLGTLITSKVNDALRSSYDSPVDKAVRDFCSRMAVDLIHERFADTIKTLVATEIEKRVTQDVMQAFISAAIDKIVRAANDRY